MDSEYLQLIRSKLQRRLKRLNAANQESFRIVLLQTWVFLQNNEVTKGILDDLEHQVPEAKDWADEFILDGCPRYPNTEVGSSAICYWLLKACVAEQLVDPSAEQLRNAEIEQLLNNSSSFRESYVEPLIDYIDEQINDKRMTLVLLKKYKHRCEWFRRDQLLAASKADTKRGEKTLVYDLYEYLHDQGVQFYIEPQSESGRIDLISSQTGKDRLVADAKIFNPDTGQNRSYIIKGFHQIYEYAKDFNEPFGYLVIFKTCEQDLSIPTQNQESSIPFITHNNKTIFIVVIDIFPYDEPASKRGKLKAYEILPSQFVEPLSQAVTPAESSKTETA